MSRKMSVDVVTGLREGQRRKRCSIFSKGKGLLFYLKFWIGSGAHPLPYQCVRGAFLRGKATKA
jgi:hypothetical protein